MNTNTSSFGKFGIIFFLIILAVGFFLISNPEVSSAVNSVKNADLYYSEPVEISPIILHPEMEIYYGENENDTIYLMNVGDLFNKNKHPLEKHGIKAVITLVCLNKGRGVLELKREADERKAVICNINVEDLFDFFTLEELQEFDPDITLEGLKKYDGKYGVGIFSKTRQGITLFIKENKSNLNQVIQYLHNSGYFGG
jgi:hypothetical protein